MPAGSGWGYFILIVFLVNMLADILTLLVAATFLSLHTQTTSEFPTSSSCMPDPAGNKVAGPLAPDACSQANSTACCPLAPSAQEAKLQLPPADMTDLRVQSSPSSWWPSCWGRPSLPAHAAASRSHSTQPPTWLGGTEALSTTSLPTPITPGPARYGPWPCRRG